MPSNNLNGEPHIIDLPKYPKTYSMPAPVHEAIPGVVSKAEHGGAKTNRSEMLAALVHHAMTGMNEDELMAAWFAYRKSSAASLQPGDTPSPE